MRDALEAWLAPAWGAERVAIDGLAPLSGGAIQENRGFEAEVAGGPMAGRHELVLRLDAPSGLPMSRPRAEEYALIHAARAAGVTAPEALALCADPGVIGRAFFVMRRAPGIADPRALTGEPERPGLAAALGAELAALHRIAPPRADLGFLGDPPADPARAAVALVRGWLDGLGEPRPALEWGLAALEARAPDPVAPALCHRDFRTGNLLVEGSRVAAVLDWEFAGWSDPAEDIGWVSAPCWRFRRPEAEAGGLGSLDDLLAGYAAAGGTPPSPERIAWWQAMATARWAAIALWQAERHRSGAERSLELALTAHLVPELELELLVLTPA
jgi:aminoglycoside phosphotransferase (APT) family kinase protein